MYNSTAFLYDATAAFEEPDQACEQIHRILAHCGLTPPGVLGDLGAGTGLMSILLAERGWEVHGIELAPAMIAVAQEKLEGLSPETRARLHWEQGDITAFQLPDNRPWDGAVSMCNTINHLTASGQLQGFSRCVHKALRPGGVLIFDSDTLETFQGFFHHEPTVVWDDGTHQLTRACRFDPATGRADHVASLARYAPGGLQTVSREEMALQYHTEGSLRDTFTAAGFKLEGAVPYNPNPRLYAGFIPKVLWVFRKPVSG
jgi:SAM-dependent methyltransferase